MAWIASTGAAHHPMKLCKDEQSDRLVIGLISSNVPSACQDIAPVSRKRQQKTLVYQKGDFVDDDDMCDDLTNMMSEKKRRLTIDQVKYLETSFNVDLKLEPERKALIAKKLGLRPRQVAIWFQNRRARWKNKRLEQDYEALKEKLDATMRENENMVKKNEAIMDENKRLHAKVAHLTSMVRDRNVPLGIAKSMGDGPARSLADLDSDSESGLKEEQLSTKSELASPAKSDDQSEMHDSDRSCPNSEEALVAFVEQPTGEISSFITCTAVKYEAEHGPLSPSEEEGFVNTPLLFQQYLSGFHVEDFLFGLEDHSYEFTWDG